MHAIARCAETALRTSPHPALLLGELVELIATSVDRGLTPARLRTILEAHPDAFRILEAWQGPWRSRESGVREVSTEAWVVAIAGPGGAPDTPRTALRLRESVRWLGHGVDPRSRLEVSRWYAIALAERSAREAVARRAA
jgi:hypothetical protein